MAEPVIINAEGAVLGRLATDVAKRLLKGEQVIIVNAERAVITGQRDNIMEHYKHKRDLGGARMGPLYPRMPHLMVRRSVRGMLPFKTPHGRDAYRRLKCHISVPDELKGKELKVVKQAMRPPTHGSMTVGEVSKLLGAKWEVRQ
jgi:large subunit ribosomal protein L13